MKEVAIKEICTKGSSSLKQKELLPEGKYPVYGASGIAGYLDTFHQESNYIGIVKDGSGIGRVAFYPEKTSLIGTMQYILPKKGFNIRYIGYCLQSLDLSKYKQGAAIPHIYFRDYGERIVKVTDDENEQLSIVSRLDAAFAKIDALKANAEQQLNEARALFSRALTEEMTPKEGWEEKKVKEIANVKGGKRVPKGYKLESTDTGHKYIRVSDFREDGTIDESNILFISDEVFKQIKNYTISSDDVYISIAGTIGKSGIIPKSLDGSNLTENACKLVFTKPVDKRFIYLCTKSEYFKKQIDKATKQASQPKLALTRLAEVVLYLPTIETQRSIITRLDALSSNVRQLEEVQRKTMAECDALKQAILKEVFE